MDAGGWYLMMEPFRTNIVPNTERSDALCLYNIWPTHSIGPNTQLGLRIENAQDPTNAAGHTGRYSVNS